MLSLHVAANNYESGSYETAADMLEKYLNKHPNNPCALIILCKTYAQLGKFQLAVQSIKKAADIIHSVETYNYYLNEIERIKNKDKIIFDSNFDQPLDFKISENFHESKTSAINEAETFENMLVSETLASIYISQGEFKEAIKIYEKLIERKPENENKYLDIIKELNSRLKT